MSHNVFAKAYVEMRNAKYNPDGTLKENAANQNSAQDVKTDAKPDAPKDENQYGPAIIGVSRIGQCYIV